jgi:hypothetical protein
MMAARVVCPVSYLLLAVASTIGSTPAVGLIERILATTCSLWIGALAANLIIVARWHSTGKHPVRESRDLR